jgi:hypothetical protein
VFADDPNHGRQTQATAGKLGAEERIEDPGLGVRLPESNGFLFRPHNFKPAKFRCGMTRRGLLTYDSICCTARPENRAEIYRAGLCSFFALRARRWT